MTDNRETHLTIVEGDVVRDSPLKTFALCMLTIFVLAPLGVGMVWAWWMEYSFLDRQIAWYGAVIGAVFVLGGICAIPVSLFCFFRRNRLILGNECFQVVRHDKVTVQIPYRNMDRIEMDKSDVLGKYVGFDLRNPNESGTVCPGADITKNGFGWHYTLYDESWTLPLAQIREELVKRLSSIPSATK